MAGKRLYSLRDGSERYWLQRARQADKAAGRTVTHYDRFDSARMGWRLLAFTFLAWEVLGRDPVIRTGNPFRLNGGYQERWDFDHALISDDDLDAVVKRAPILGSLVMSPAGITDRGLRRALEQTGAGAEIPELGDGFQLSHVCATATHFHNRNGTYHALILPADGPPVEVDPEEWVPELCADLATAYASLQRAMQRPDLDWGDLEHWAATIHLLTATIREAVWEAYTTGQVVSRPAERPELIPAPSHEVLLHLLGSLSPLSVWEADGDTLRHPSAYSTLSVPASDAAALLGRLNDEALLVFLIALGRWCQTATSNEQAVPVSVQDVLDVRRIVKHKHGGYKTDDKRRVADTLRDLNAIAVVVHAPWRDTPSPSPLLDVQPAGPGKPYEFLIRPGDWISAGGHPTRQLGYWFAALAELDRRHEGSALRLGLYLCLHYRVRAGYRNLAQPWRVATLVAAAQPATGQVAGRLDRRNPKRLRSTLENTLDRLRQLGVVASWEYVGDEPMDEGKGWFDAWMAAKIVVRPPQALSEQYRTVSVSRKNAALPTRLASADASA